MDIAIWVKVLARFVHIASAVTLAGGVIALKCVAGPVTNEMARKWRGVVLWSGLGLVLAGMWNLMTKENPPPGYHMWFGIKFLLALHVLAVSAVAAKESTPVEKRGRLLGGAMWSALAVIAISAWLRWMS
jgi:hypothetical protein